MEINILEITERITINSGVSVIDWPSFVKWMKSQLPLRRIIGYDYSNVLSGWEDEWTSDGSNYISRTKTFDDAVLSSEIEGLLKSAPLLLSQKESIEIRNYLINMGFLVAHLFDDRVSSYALIQFRI